MTCIQPDLKAARWDGCCLKYSPTENREHRRSMAASSPPPSYIQNATSLSSGRLQRHAPGASRDPGVGADIPGKGPSPVYFPSLPCNPELTSAAHLAGLRSPVYRQGKGSLSVGISGLTWTASPRPPRPRSVEKFSPVGCLSGRLLASTFQTPESSLLGPILCLTSLQGPLMNI